MQHQRHAPTARRQQGTCFPTVLPAKQIHKLLYVTPASAWIELAVVFAPMLISRAQLHMPFETVSRDTNTPSASHLLPTYALIRSCLWLIVIKHARPLQHCRTFDCHSRACLHAMLGRLLPYGSVQHCTVRALHCVPHAKSVSGFMEAQPHNAQLLDHSPLPGDRVVECPLGQGVVARQKSTGSRRPALYRQP
jgi:hypothetical protein